MAKNPKNSPSPPINLRTAVAGKPDLLIHAADLPTTARALAKLLAEQCMNLFVHSRRPVLVLPADQDSAPTMHPVTSNEVIIAAHKLCQPVKRKPSGERKEVTLPKQVAELYLAMPEEWQLRPLISFASTPILRDDGSIHCENGYDALTGVYIYNVPKITVPDKPSRDDAKRALATLRKPFRTFAFADRIEVDETFSIGDDKITVKVVDLKQPPGKDESAHLAGLLTAVCRPSLLNAPIIATRSPSISGSGAGKKLLLDGHSCIAFGRPGVSVGCGHGEEFEKGFVAAVIGPELDIVIDNVNGRVLQSEKLCTVATDRPAMVRPLGVSELKEANPRQLIRVTGNAFTFAEDLVRRNFVIGIDPKVENPELRRFAGDFLTDVKRQRVELLGAALIVWLFGRQQVKSNSPPLGGYERWTRWVRDPLVALGCQDPIEQIAKAKAADPERRNKAEVFQTWWWHHGDDRIQLSKLHAAVKALLEPDPKKRSRQNISYLVDKLVGTRLAGFHLGSNKNVKTAKWTPIMYRLEWVGDENQPATTPPARASHEAAQGDLYKSKPGARPTDAPSPDDAPPPDDVPPADDEMSKIAAAEMAHGGWRPKSGSEAATETKSETEYAGGMPFVMTNTMKQQLRARGYSDEQIANLTPQEARNILDKNVKAAQDAPPAPEPITGDLGDLDDLDDPDGYYFNREPAAGRSEPAASASPAAPTTAPPDRFNAEECVALWRNAFAALNPQTEPCPGYRVGEWPRAHACGKQFLAGPHALAAARAGWSVVDLFGVHKVTVMAARDCVGALTANSMNGFVCRIEADGALQFTNGTKVQKRSLDSNISIPIWSFRAR